MKQAGPELATADVERLRSLVDARGDARRGRARFRTNTVVTCSHCHRRDGVGENVGPDLNELPLKKSFAETVQSLVHPGVGVLSPYRVYHATLRSGGAVAGMMVRQSERDILLREAIGTEVRIRRGDLSKLTGSSAAFGHEDVLSALSSDQFLDLMAYLSDREAGRPSP